METCIKRIWPYLSSYIYAKEEVVGGISTSLLARSRRSVLFRLGSRYKWPVRYPCNHSTTDINQTSSTILWRGITHHKYTNAKRHIEFTDVIVISPNKSSKIYTHKSPGLHYRSDKHTVLRVLWIATTYTVVKVPHKTLKFDLPSSPLLPALLVLYRLIGSLESFCAHLLWWYVNVAQTEGGRT